jgi:hypothetical protein
MAMAASIPPGCTCASDRENRLSAIALSTVVIISGVSQNACSVICGIRIISTVELAGMPEGNSTKFLRASFVIRFQVLSASENYYRALPSPKEAGSKQVSSS